MKHFRKYIVPFLLAIIFLIGTTIRFIGLGHNPIGMVDDEVEKGYDAYSLLRTGKDQWGASWPITSFRGFGDYSLPAYTYLAMPSVKIFGLTPFAVRFPSAFFGSLTILLVYALAKELFRLKQDTSQFVADILPLLAAFFLAISPWHIGLSRVAIEQAISVFFITAGLLTLLMGRRHPSWIAAAGLLFGFSLFVYRPNILLVPFLLLLVFISYGKEYRKSWKWILAGFFGLIFIASPILFSLGGSAFGARSEQVNLTNDPGIVDLVNEKRGDCARVFPGTVCRIVFNKYSAYGTRFVSNYLNHFSPSLLSVNGTNTQYSVLPSRGLLYLIDYPLLILSVIVVFLNFTPARAILIGLLLFSAIPDSFTSDGHYARFFISFPAWPILLSLGTVTALSYIRKWRIVIGLGVIVYLVTVSFFLVEYWTFFPYRYSVYSHYGYEELIRDIVRFAPGYDRIIVSSRVNDAKQYIYYLFYTKYDPALFQSGKGIEKVMEPNGWVRVRRINSIEFLPAFPVSSELSHGRILLIGAPSEFPKTVPKVAPAMAIPVEFTVTDKAGHILFEGVDSSKLYSCTKAECNGIEGL
jgi:hypothetical protein